MHQKNITHPLVSVIIPVFNTEETLARCVNSVSNQSYCNLEILLIDDGSKDKSAMICESLAAKDPRIRVYHQCNKGLSAARNTGMRHATGEYLTFVDSDDSICPQMTETLLAALQTTDCSIAVSDIAMIGPAGNADHLITRPSSTMDEYAYWNEALMCSASRNSIQFIVSWGKLYRKSIFNDIQFDAGKLHEDEFIIHRIIHKAQKITFAPGAPYLYYSNPDGITHNKNAWSYLDAAEALLHRAQYFDLREWEQLDRWAIEGAAWNILEARMRPMDAATKKRMEDIRREFSTVLSWTRPESFRQFIFAYAPTFLLRQGIQLKRALLR